MDVNKINIKSLFNEYSGERTWKIVGAKTTATLNGVQINYNAFNESVLYLFPEVSVTAQGYTKHIFAGTERICSKVGTGRSWPTSNPVVPIIPSPATANAKQTAQRALIRKVFTNMCIPTQYPLRLCLPQISSNIMHTSILQSSLISISTSTTTVENVRYFYNADHLGSTSFVSDRTGTPLQYLSYEPFGKVIHNQKATNSTYETDFRFLGKDYDFESGYNRLDNRYYWSAGGMFISSDQLAECRPWISSYNYAQNNPINRSDKSGLLDDEYQFDKLGNLVNTIPNDKIDKLTILGDKKNISSREFRPGTFEGKINTAENGDTFIEGLEGKTAESVFNFMSDNSSAEWGYMETINGDCSSNFLVGTGHNEFGETAVYPKAMRVTEGSVVKYDHSHPNSSFFNRESSGYPSNSNTSIGGNNYSDVDAWGALKNRNPNVSVGIRHDGRTRSFNQNKSGSWKETYNK
jgi:RHS repeat-associated protein